MKAACGPTFWWRSTPAGNRIWEWHSSEHLDTETDVLTYCDMRDEWAHGNTIVPLSGDRVMVSFRNISTVGIIDKKSGQVDLEAGLQHAGPAARPQHVG